MELFYTVASMEGVAQSKALNSLGGFCSSSKVANANFDAVFGEVSNYALQKPRPEYIGLILKNTLNRPVENLKIWTKAPSGAICKLRVAVVELSDNGEMELIPSVNSMPMYAEFYDAVESDPIEIEGSFGKGMMMGLWLERSIDTSSESVAKRNDCDYLFEQFSSGQALETDENLELKISFDYGE